MATYDSNKKYSWSPEDRFEVTGEQFGLLINAFRAVLSTPEAMNIMLVSRANKTVEEIMANAVEKDIVKEVIE